MNMHRAHLLSIATLLAGCGVNDECRRLTELHKAWENTRLTADTRAKLLPKILERASQLEAASDKLVADTWIELPDATLGAELDKRVAGVPTASVSRSQTMVGNTEEGDNVSTTEFTVRFREKDVGKAWGHVVAMSQVPPLLLLNSVIREQDGDGWMVRLHRVLPQRSPFKPARVPLEKPDDPSKIPGQFGFCGAGDLRKKIADVQEKVRAVEADAEQATVMIAAGPTAEGVRRRVEKVLKTEREAREIMSKVVESVAEKKLPFKAIGYDEPAVVVELFGGPKELKALETLLLPFGDRVKPTELAAPGVVRRQIVVVQPKKEAPPFGELPGGPGAAPKEGGHEGHDHP